MQSTDGSRSGGRRLKDRLARLLRPANSLFRSPCSSSSSASTFTTTTAATTVSTASSSATTAALRARVEPFSASLDLLRHPSPEHKQRCSSTRHARRRHLTNDADDHKGARKLSSNPYGFTTDEEDDSDDTEAFLSARSLVSSDSSGFYTSAKQLPGKSRSYRDRHHNRQRQQQQTTRRRRRRRAAGCLDACSVRDEDVGFRPLVTTAEAELRKGLAVVKRSRDPYGDFRESMVEMIVERQMFGAAELQRLLRTYLSLNSPRLHPVILQAFSDIWVVLRGC